jgi:1-acyl-sn-glycerol-3-phosphate acyltransferase
MRVHFRRIFVKTIANIPRKGPVLLSCNHPNSFLDAVAVSLILKRDVHFLVRSDVFKKPWANYLLRKLNMIPIYRLQDGVENLDRNNETFRICSELLGKGEVVLIFSEGNCVVEKRLRTLKKGTARIWFGAMEAHNWQLEIPIIPVGINYSHPYDFRTELMVSFGKALHFSDLKESWYSDNAHAIKVFNERLTQGVFNEMLIIPEQKFDLGTEDLLDLKRSLHHYPLFKTYYFEPSRFDEENRFLKQLFQTENHQQIIEEAHRTGQALRTAGFRVNQFSTEISRWNTLFLILGFIPAMVSFLINALPIWLTRKALVGTQKDPKFRASVMMGASAIISYVFYLLITLIGMIFSWKMIFCLVVFPWLTVLTVVWWEQLQLRRARMQEHVWYKKSPDLMMKLEMSRENLFMQSGAINLSPAEGA